MKRLFGIIVFVVLTVLLCTSVVYASDITNTSASHFRWYSDAQGNAAHYDDRTGTIIGYHMGDSSSDIMAFIPYAGDFPLREIGDELFKKDSGEWHDFTTVIIPEGIKRIGKSAFENCTDIVKVVLPESLECIDDSAFKGCTNLSDINLPDNISYLGKLAFASTAITELEIPENTVEINESCFSNCSKLTTVTFNESLETIRQYAFYRTAIKDVYIPDGTSSIDGTAFMSTPWLDGYDSDFIVINNTLVRYKGSASLIQIPGNVYYISDRAFYNTPIKGVMLHSKIWGIGDEAFSQTSGLSNMTIPETVTYIGEGVFKGSGVGVVEFPSWMTKIPDYTFYDSEINTLCLHSNITEIGDYAYAKSTCSGPIPDYVRKIGAYAFDSSSIKGNIQLENVDIGEYAFYMCKGIQTVDISGKSDIGNYAFMVCDPLAVKVLTLGPDVRIGDHAFDWTGINHIEGVSDKIEYIGAGAFMQTDYWFNLRKEPFIIAGDGNLLNVYFNDENADIVIPEGVKRISGQAFQSVKCNRVILPSTLEVIRPNAFAVSTGYGATITEIVLPDKEFIIEEKAFRNCSTLKKINFPKWLTKVPDYAFAGCSSLVLDSIEGVEEIGEYAFSGVKCLKDGKVPKSVKKLCTGALTMSFDKHVYLEHLPEMIEDHPFGSNGTSAAVNTYIHVAEDLLDYNPDWNDCSLVIHRKIEITDSGDDYVTMYFKSGVSDNEHNQLVYYDWVKMNGFYFNNLSYFDVVDDYTIRLNNASKYMGGTLDFEIMLSGGNYLTKYDPVVIQSAYITYGDFTYSPGGKILSYNGSEDIVRIPSEINGTLIQSVAADAFGTDNICIYVPESVRLLQKNFAKHPNTIICFEGELPDMEIGALGDNMLLYNRLYSHPVAGGYDMRKVLTESCLYSIADMELYNDTTLHILFFADMAEWFDTAAVVTKISFTDGTDSIYITPVEDNGFRLLRYQTGKNIADAQSHIWHMSNIKPLAYSDSLK